MAGSRRVRVADNVRRNLDAIREFLTESGAPEAFETLLDELFAKVIPSLQEFPELGFDFLARRPGSRETAAGAERWRRRLGPGENLREHVFGQYLLLYLTRRDEVVLLTLRHHRQLSFDLRGHWGAG